METVEAILEELDVLPAARMVYLSLLRDGEATARMLAKRTGVTRPSVYDQVRELRNKGLVVERDIDGTTYFGTSDIRTLEHLLDERIERLELGRTLLSKNMASLLAESRAVQPKIRFFESDEGVREMLKDMLWYENIRVDMCFPYHHMRAVFTDEYLAWFNTRRVRNHIALRTIWAHDERTGKHVFSGADEFVERRYARKEQPFSMAYAIYDDRVSFVSSSKESYGFLVQSREFADLMRMQFEAVWRAAKQ